MDRQYTQFGLYIKIEVPIATTTVTQVGDLIANHMGASLFHWRFLESPDLPENATQWERLPFTLLVPIPRPRADGQMYMTESNPLSDDDMLLSNLVENRQFRPKKAGVCLTQRTIPANAQHPAREEFDLYLSTSISLFKPLRSASKSDGYQLPRSDWSASSPSPASLHSTPKSTPCASYIGFITYTRLTMLERPLHQGGSVITRGRAYGPMGTHQRRLRVTCQSSRSPAPLWCLCLLQPTWTR